MKKNTIILVVISILLSIVAGFFIGKSINMHEKCKETEKVEYKKSTLEEIKRMLGDNYYEDESVSDYTICYLNQVMFVFTNDEKKELVNVIPNASEITTIDKFETKLYQVEMKTGNGDLTSTTVILDKDFNNLIQIDNKYMGRPVYNTNETIAIPIIYKDQKNIQIYNLKGEKIKTIDNVLAEGLIEDYYLENKDGKYELVNYETAERVLIVNDKNLKLSHSPTSDNLPLIYWNDEENIKMMFVPIEYKTSGEDIYYFYNFNTKTKNITHEKKIIKTDN